MLSVRDLRSFSSPLLTIVLLSLGHGLLSTKIVREMVLREESTFLVAAATAMNYFGLILLSFSADKFIMRVGHIRGYASAGTIMASSILVQCFFYEPYLWVLLRFLQGMCLAVLYVAVESWLLSSSSVANRGQVLSL